MRAIWQNIRYAVRVLFRRRISFTVIAVITLAIGVGANTAIFSFINSILIRPLSYNNPDQLVVLHEQNDSLGLKLPRASVGNFIAWRDQSRSFSQIAAIRFKTFLLSGRDEPEWISGGLVSASLFDLLGVKSVQGRSFLSGEDSPGKSNVAIISHGLWQRRFGADPRLIGNAVVLDDQSYEIVGVMPPGFGFPEKLDVWVPITLDAAAPAARRARMLMIVARLEEGVAQEEAQAEMDMIAGQLEQSYPDSNAGWGVKLNSFHDEFVGRLGNTLLIFQIAVAFVFLIACANVMNLLLAQAATRQREAAIRAALGASKRQLIQQFLAENLVLALCGGVLGFLLAYSAIPFLTAMSPSELPRLSEVRLDGQVFAFAMFISVIAAFVFGLAPALSTTNGRFASLLKEGGQRLAGGGRSRRLLNAIVVMQVALALMLLLSAGLMIKSLMRLQNVALGFNSQNLLTMRVSLPASKYSQPNQQRAFFQQLLEQVGAMPGVEDSGAITELPIGGSNSVLPVSTQGSLPLNAQDQPMSFHNAVSSNYFRAMGIPLVAGRYFSENEEQAVPPVIIDEMMANRLWPGENPVGKHLITTAGRPTSYEVVGVVKTIKYQKPDLQNNVSAMYVPYSQFPQPRLALIIRSVLDADVLAEQVRQAVRKLDKDQPVSEINTMEAIISESIAPRRFYTYLLSIFAFVALTLAVVGIYGILSYSAARRAHEIGIRMALGAQQKDVLKMVLGRNLVLVLIGVIIGLTGAYLMTRFLAALLYEVTATDGITFAVVTAVLIFVALVASYLPARKAARVDPAIVLRHE